MLEKFVTTRGTIRFSKKTLVHGVSYWIHWNVVFLEQIKAYAVECRLFTQAHLYIDWMSIYSIIILSMYNTYMHVVCVQLCYVKLFTMETLYSHKHPNNLHIINAIWDLKV